VCHQQRDQLENERCHLPHNFQRLNRNRQTSIVQTRFIENKHQEILLWRNSVFNSGIENVSPFHSWTQSVAAIPTAMSYIYIYIYIYLMYIFRATKSWIHTNLQPTSCIIFCIYNKICYMFRPYILTIFKFYIFWSACTEYIRLVIDNWQIVCILKFKTVRIFRRIKWRKIKWAGHVASMGGGEMHKRFWWGDGRERDHF
jgi:hypothetical protein